MATVMGRCHRTLRHPQEKEISVSASEAVGKQASPTFLGHIGKPLWESFWQHLSNFHMGPRKSSSVWTQSGSYFFPKGTELVMNLVKLNIGRAQRCWSDRCNAVSMEKGPLPSGTKLVAGSSQCIQGKLHPHSHCPGRYLSKSELWAIADADFENSFKGLVKQLSFLGKLVCGKNRVSQLFRRESVKPE